MTMRCGINLPNFGLDVGTASLGRWADLVESTGLSYAMVSDHVVQTPDVQGGFPGRFYDPFVTLAWLAARTTTTGLGTTVTVLPYRHPALTARLAANIDQLSGGRMILGVSAGWSAQEFAALGVPFAQRGAITDSHLCVIKALWAGRPVSDAHLAGVINEPGPVGRDIAVWVGGHGAPALRRAVEHGTAWHPTSVTMDWLRTAVPRLRDFAAARGRTMPAVVPRIKLHPTAQPVVGVHRLAGQGTVDQLRTDIAGLAELGVTDFLVDTTYVGQRRTAATDDADLSAVHHFCEQIFDNARGELR